MQGYWFPGTSLGREGEAGDRMLAHLWLTDVPGGRWSLFLILINKKSKSLSDD